MFRKARIIIRNTVNQWLMDLGKLLLHAGNEVAAGFIALDDYKPWRILDGTERPPLFIPVPRRFSTQGDDAVRQYVQVSEAYNRYKSQFGDPFQGGEPFAMLETSDPLTEWRYDERVDILEQCHLAWERNPEANTAVTYNRLFAVGGGMQRTYRNEQVKEVIEAFCSNPDNAFVELEKTLIDTIQTDGELFMRFHGSGAGEDIIMTPLPPWGIQSINHEPGFIRRVNTYKYIIQEDSGDGTQLEPVNIDIPADEMIHVAINRKAYELRGRPELFKILVWLRAHKEWLENRARQNHYRGSLLYDVTLENASATQVSAKRAQYKTPPAGSAALVIHNDKETWNKFGDDINASGAKEDGREMRLQIATGMRLPEYMLSDGSMSNLATATAQALPAIYSFAEWQDIARDRIFKPMFIKVLELAGLDPNSVVAVQDPDTGEATGDTVKVRDAFEIKYRNLDPSDPKSVLEALGLAIDRELMSEETAAGLMSFDVDYQREQKKIAEKRELEMEEIAQGKRMAPFQPGFGMQQNQPTGEQNNDNGQQNQPEEQPAEDEE